LIPTNGRKQKIKAIETDLGCSLNVLRPKTAVLGLFLVIVLGFLVYILQDLKIGCAGFLVSIILFRIAIKCGNEFTINTVGDLAREITTNNYLSARRNSSVINRNEIPEIIKELFIEIFGVDRSALTPDASFI